MKTILSNPRKDVVGIKVNGMTARTYMTDFEINRTIQDLDWAIGFWKKEREATPTRKAGKCAICEFKKTCLDSLNRQNLAAGDKM